MATHQEEAVLTLREMILNGEMTPGQRLTETALAEKLDISRTPIRHALALLEQEGLLDKGDKRGYVVRTFSVDDVLGAIDVRGVLEGLAARIVAEKGVSEALGGALRQCLAIGDGIFSKPSLLPGDEALYVEMNRRFHALILEAAGNQALSNILVLNDRLPFAAASAVAFDKSGADWHFKTLSHAHQQHHAIVDALEARESVRAEALMAEHTNASKDFLKSSRNQWPIAPDRHGIVLQG
ncbi:MAG: GntR family transcriptional regulator [Pseudomonadota bacterium]